MNARRPNPILALPLLLILFLVGCGDESNSPTVNDPVATDDYANIVFDLPYGGLTMSDEMPAFDDPYLLQDDSIDGDDMYDDAYADDEAVRALLRMGEANDNGGSALQRPRFTFLRMVWGTLEGAPDDGSGFVEDGDAVNWSGELSVDRGFVLIRRVIRFEGRDRIVRPRPDRQTVVWESYTGGHFDGLLIQIIEPPLDADGDGEIDEEFDNPNMLHFTTPPFTRNFQVAGLPDLDQVYEVEPDGNAIHFAGFGLSDLDPCPKGFLAGIWRHNPDADDGSGTFRGRWMGLYGLGMGHMMGSYGYDSEGNAVFFGKYINRTGQFRGLLAGTWTPDDDESGRGKFLGYWVNAAETVEGVLGGSYFDPPLRDGGFYQGRWATDCDDEAVDDIEG